MPPVSQHSMLSHYQSETETLNICIFWQEIVCQQKYLTSVLFVDRHNWSLSCSMINATCLDVATKHSKLQKKMHSWYAYVTHTCLDVATKTRKLQKNASMTYACVIHVCLDVALREGKSAPLCKFRKYSPTDWAQNQSLVNITTLRYSKIHHL